jgi:hypothetical protein
MGRLEALISGRGTVTPQVAQQIAQVLTTDAAGTARRSSEIAKFAARVVDAISNARGKPLSFPELATALEHLLGDRTFSAKSTRNISEALAKAEASDWIVRDGTAISANAETRSEWEAPAAPATHSAKWDVAGLPDRLYDLAKAIADAGGEAESCDLQKVLGEAPAKILADHQQRWSKWIKQFIKKPRRGVYVLKQ